jgi:hypothetical protein
VHKSIRIFCIIGMPSVQLAKHPRGDSPAAYWYNKHNKRPSTNMHAAMASTTIRIDTETRDELQSRGRMGESYDQVIQRLLAATRSRDGSHPEPTRKPTSPSQRPLFAHQDRI